MRVGLFTDGLQHLSRRDASRGAPSAASPTSSWAWAPGAAPPSRPRHDRHRAERDRLAGELREHGLRLGPSTPPAISSTRTRQARRRSGAPAGRGRPRSRARRDASGHDERLSRRPRRRLARRVPVLGDVVRRREAVQLAAGARGRSVLALARMAGREAPEVMVCLEMHPGVTIFSGTAGFEALPPTRHERRHQLRPEPLLVAGDRPADGDRSASGNRIGWAHGKDTLLHPERIRRQGVLHFAPPVGPRPRPLALRARGARATMTRPGPRCFARSARPAMTM